LQSNSKTRNILSRREGVEAKISLPKSADSLRRVWSVSLKSELRGDPDPFAEMDRRAAVEPSFGLADCRAAGPPSTLRRTFPPPRSGPSGSGRKAEKGKSPSGRFRPASRRFFLGRKGGAQVSGKADRQPAVERDKSLAGLHRATADEGSARGASLSSGCGQSPPRTRVGEPARLQRRQECPARTHALASATLLTPHPFSRIAPSLQQDIVGRGRFFRRSRLTPLTPCPDSEIRRKRGDHAPQGRAGVDFPAR